MGTNFMYANYDQNREATMTRCWVNVVMHLVLSALVGPIPLHSDNRDSFACNLFKFIAMRHLPAQCIPTRTLLFDTFGMDNGAIKPQVVKFNTWAHPDYFLRSVLDVNAWSQHAMTELDVDCWNYAIEDVFHMGPWLQMAAILNAGHPPVDLTPLPSTSYRMPELVLGRYYSLWNGPELHGTICVAPEGKSFVAVKIEEHEFALELQSWQYAIQSMYKLVVGPLVHRTNAVVRKGDTSSIGVIQPRHGKAATSERFTEYEGWENEYAKEFAVVEERFFLDSEGNYEVLCDEFHAPTKTHFSTVHANLIKLGTKVLVNVAMLKQEHPVFASKFTHNSRARWIMGWLRYPSRSIVEPNPEHVYVCFRVKRSSTQVEEKPRILGVSVNACCLPEDDVEVVDFMLP